MSINIVFFIIVLVILLGAIILNSISKKRNYKKIFKKSNVIDKCMLYIQDANQLNGRCNGFLIIDLNEENILYADFVFCEHDDTTLKILIDLYKEESNKLIEIYSINNDSIYSLEECKNKLDEYNKYAISHIFGKDYYPKTSYHFEDFLQCLKPLEPLSNEEFIIRSIIPISLAKTEISIFIETLTERCFEEYPHLIRSDLSNHRSLFISFDS